MATSAELADFLKSVERRAFRQMAYLVRDEHTALDIVQDAMMKLAEHYWDKPVAEYPMLFQRILQNTIRDFWRKQKVRRAWTSTLSSFVGNEEGEDYDVLEHLATEQSGQIGESPEQQLSRTQTMQQIEAALKKLPDRQREAFVLRYWQDMDVAETASLMGCSEGSVKTHCSRAVHAMAKMLGSQGHGKPSLPADTPAVGSTRAVRSNGGETER